MADAIGRVAHSLCPTPTAIGADTVTERHSLRPLPLGLAFVDHADVDLCASTALRTHFRDVLRRVVPVGHDVAPLLRLQAAPRAAGGATVLLQTPKPAIYRAHGP